jgi:hypothetical protein
MAYWAWFAARKGVPSDAFVYEHGDLVALTPASEPLQSHTVEAVLYGGELMSPYEAARAITKAALAAAIEMSDAIPVIAAEMKKLVIQQAAPEQERRHFRCLVDDATAEKLVAQLTDAQDAEQSGAPVPWPSMDLNALPKSEKDATYDTTKATVIAAPQAWLDAVKA